MRDPIVSYRVVDGDTIEAVLDLRYGVQREVTIRLSGMDAPKKSTPEGRAATVALGAMMAGAKQAMFECDVHPTRGTQTKDVYGRFVGMIWDAHNSTRAFNADMIEQGHAQPWDWHNRLGLSGLPKHLSPGDD